MFAYYDNYHRRIYVVGYAVTCILDSEAHACRPAVPSLYQTMTKKLSGLYKVYQSINLLSMFAILQSDLVTFLMYLLNIRAYMHLAGNLVTF